MKDETLDLADTLTSHERDLLLGKCDGWGSWMFIAAEHMVSVGLGTKRNGSIRFDTPLAKKVIAALKARGGQNEG